jgi:hypothetical protein
MTFAKDLLFRCSLGGIRLRLEGDGSVAWEADADPAPELLAALTANKADVVALLATGLTPVPPWDQGEADRVLSKLRAEVDQLRRSFGGKFPEPLGTIVADYVDVAEGYAHDREAEAARGWDPLELLRGVRPRLLAIVQCWKASRGKAS